MSTIRLIAILFTITLCTIVHGQKKYGRLVIKTELSNAGLWDSISVSSNHFMKRIKRYDPHRTIVDSLIPGDYTVTLHSKFGHRISKNATVKKKGKVTFDTRYFYKQYTDTGSVLDAMAIIDTAIIYYVPGGSWSQKSGLFKIVKAGSDYKIVIKNAIDIWIGAPLSAEELAELKTILKNPTYLSTLGYYTLCINTTLVQRSCGTCIHGFLMRKRLVGDH